MMTRRAHLKNVLNMGKGGSSPEAPSMILVAEDLLETRTWKGELSSAARWCNISNVPSISPLYNSVCTEDYRKVDAIPVRPVFGVVRSPRNGL
jgi:hypothetical protein